ncbi:carbamoyltransferase HypF [Natronomonas sp. F2-12]|uniref:Carbamoyltransferase n=1 Tax=Natronomonas aquatica TaxID=2841590 RepID=A0A9R1CVX4_9EURY|nr:carbamoyltransferase HypF [Natronomonas aquatica]MCQ4334722.1 carbamoyltransferase HypF [Natronomonas aquatica]
MERATIRVNGIVQSVGFRPFVYRRAVAHGLHGTVRNLGDAGVRIEAEGQPDAIDAFLTDIKNNPPPLARITSITVDREHTSESMFETFEIVESQSGDSGGGSIPPDTAICENCLADLRDPESRYHNYWATSCVDCGPRFTVVESLPYDRHTTSMAAFPMCEECRSAYENPADRRYHAQTIACCNCGPQLRYGTVSDSQTTDPAVSEAGRDRFPDTLLETASGKEAIKKAAASLRDGKLVVVKGIGGAHITCSATDTDAITRLRNRTDRPEKPFAVMASNIETIQSFTDLSSTERDTLNSFRRPIVLIEATGSGLADRVAPDLHTVGVMLPYSGIHYRLFDRIEEPLVMTSANLPGQPMLRSNNSIVDGLDEVADGFLLHDRRIVTRCDDSVARIVDGERRLIRRSRGFAPTAISLPNNGEMSALAVGAELDVTAAILEKQECYYTQYVGDVDSLDTLAYLKNAIQRLLDVTGTEWPSVVVHDLHPAFNTTDYAKELVDSGTVARAVSVQHHHAHAASVLAEHDCHRALSLTLDGVGYGPDGTVWGGEVLDATRTGFERVGSLAPVPMPGGDKATTHPARLTAGILYAADPDRVEAILERHDVQFPGGDRERNVVIQQLESDVNTPQTSSAGRFLDAVAALLGVCTRRTYEGEPAMKLEAAAARGSPHSLSAPISSLNGRRVVNTPQLFTELVRLRSDGVSVPDIAATAQETLARGLADLAIEEAEIRNCETVSLSGGVAYNEHIASQIRDSVSNAGLSFITNRRVPPGDGGIAYGQLAVVAAQPSH